MSRNTAAQHVHSLVEVKKAFDRAGLPATIPRKFGLGWAPRRMSEGLRGLVEGENGWHALVFSTDAEAVRLYRYAERYTSVRAPAAVRKDNVVAYADRGHVRRVRDALKSLGSD